MKPVAPRAIAYRTTGSGHGAIVRLMSPGDLGQWLKPFVFLDLFEGESAFINGMPMHPHSGIATVTLITEGNLRFDDADSGQGFIDYGGVEWMRAGGGVWHGKEMSVGTSPRIQAFNCGWPCRRRWKTPASTASTWSPAPCPRRARHG